MKKKIALFAVSALALVALISATVVLSLYGVFDVFDNTINGEFSIEDHTVYKIMFDVEHIEEFIYLGKIDDISELRKQAQKIWIDEYGIEVRLNQRPYKVLYDPKHDLYLVSGSLDSAFGGVANIFVERETGRVLAVWHEK